MGVSHDNLRTDRMQQMYRQTMTAQAVQIADRHAIGAATTGLDQRCVGIATSAREVAASASRHSEVCCVSECDNEASTHDGLILRPEVDAAAQRQ